MTAKGGNTPSSRTRTTPVGRSPRTRLEMVAIALTAAALVGLALAKVVMRPMWRAHARAGMTRCLHGYQFGRPVDRLHLTGRAAACAARLEPMHTDYLELAVALLLLVLLALEMRLLVRDHRSRGTAHSDPAAGHAWQPPRPRSATELTSGRGEDDSTSRIETAGADRRRTVNGRGCG